MSIYLLVLAWFGVIGIVFAAITRPWKSPVHRAPLPLGLAIAIGLWGLWVDGQKYRVLMEEGAWTAATLAIVITPAGILIGMLLAYAFGRSVIAVRGVETQGLRRWGFVLVLGALFAVMVGQELFSYRDFVRYRTASSTTLTPEQRQALVERVRTGLAYDEERYAFLENPTCPPELLAEIARKGDQRSRIAVARNPSINSDLALDLSRDEDADVRYYVTHNAALPPSEFSRLAADVSEQVREAVAWKKSLPDPDFERLLNDPSPRVRATVALQPRLADEALKRLAADANPAVSSNAQRIMTQRGL